MPAILPLVTTQANGGYIFHNNWISYRRHASDSLITVTLLRCGTGHGRPGMIDFSSLDLDKMCGASSREQRLMENHCADDRDYASVLESGFPFRSNKAFPQPIDTDSSALVCREADWGLVLSGTPGVQHQILERAALMPANRDPEWGKFVGMRIMPLRPIWPGFIANTASLYAIFVLFVLLPRKALRSWRATHCRCTYCGYPVVHRAGNTCPECGTTNGRRP